MSDLHPLTLALVGPMGSGKTSIGRRVARLLDVPFIDTDKRVVAAHGPIPEIFVAHGEPQFREWEREAVTTALAEGGVISLGGGVVTQPATRAILADYPVAFLTVSKDAVADRIKGAARPLLNADEDPLDRWARILEERRAWYEEVATAVFDTSRRPMTRIAQEIADWRRGLA
jgi:shikimate kinase